MHTCMDLPGGSVGKNPSAKQETRAPSLGQQDPLEKEMTTHSSILAWRILWTEKPGGLQSTGSQRVGHNLTTRQQSDDMRVYIHTPFLSSVTFVAMTKDFNMQI